MMTILLAMPLCGGSLWAAMKWMEVMLHGLPRRCVLMGCLRVRCMRLHVVKERLQRVRGGQVIVFPRKLL